MGTSGTKIEDLRHHTDFKTAKSDVWIDDCDIHFRGRLIRRALEKKFGGSDTIRKQCNDTSSNKLKKKSSNSNIINTKKKCLLYRPMGSRSSAGGT